MVKRSDVPRRFHSRLPVGDGILLPDSDSVSPCAIVGRYPGGLVVLIDPDPNRKGSYLCWGVMRRGAK